MTKKLQVFVSSTYTDMKEERQAAVEVILRAGHIPAGMELFAAEDKSQWEVIQRWIDDSDVFLLILGGRYGTVAEGETKSYVHREYEYAKEKNKKPFAVLIEDRALDAKAAVHGPTVREKDHVDAYKGFRAAIEAGRLCAYFSDAKDIKLAVFTSLSNLRDDPGLQGWVRPGSATDNGDALKTITELTKENARLKKLLEAKPAAPNEGTYNGIGFQELGRILCSEMLVYNEGPGRPPVSRPIFEWAFDNQRYLASGISSASDERSNNFIFEIGQRLIVYGLTESKPVGAGHFTIKLTSSGQAFFAEANLKLHRTREAMEQSAPIVTTPATQKKGSA